VDIFSKDFLFIPIHDALHWSLLIVCFPGEIGAAYEDQQRREQERALGAGGGGSGAGSQRGTPPEAAVALAEEGPTLVGTPGARRGGGGGGGGGGARGGAAAAAPGELVRRPVILHLDSLKGGAAGAVCGGALQRCIPPGSCARAHATPNGTST
jgi:Ulp1 family protease